MMIARVVISLSMFAITVAVAPANAATERTVYEFGPKPRGLNPGGGLVALGGLLYGTTQQGGTGPCKAGCGTIYSVTPAGRETVIYSFQGGIDGSFPNSALTLLNGVLYGTTGLNGANSRGVIFSVTPQGAYKVLHAIGLASGGAANGALTALNGLLYGLSYGGGSTGCGVAYSISPTGAYAEIHDFGSGTEPCGPGGPLSTDGQGLYGTSFYGGTAGSGSVFRLTPAGAVQLIHSFAAVVYPTGVTPFGGKLFGTTYSDGLGLGTVYSVTLADVFSTVHVFSGPDGSGPLGTLTASRGNLFGTTMYGGGGTCFDGCGAVFALSGGEQFMLLHGFSGSEGAYPTTTVTVNNGSLYGTANQGGGYGHGTVFAIGP